MRNESLRNPVRFTVLRPREPMREPARSDLHHYQRRHHQIMPSNGHRDDARVLKGATSARHEGAWKPLLKNTNGLSLPSIT